MARKIKALLAVELARVGVVAKAIEVIPGADGGVIIRVSWLREIEPAEKVAAEWAGKLGVEMLVAF